MTVPEYKRAPSSEEEGSQRPIRSNSNSSDTKLVAVPLEDAKDSSCPITTIKRLNRRRTNWYNNLDIHLPFGLSERYSGWRLGVLGSIICVFCVFLINLIVTIWATTKHRPEGGTGILFKGDCDKASTISIWLHIAINILSTISLACSNFVSQCLIAPLRSEVDKVHKKRIWMDIGVPSVRNLRMIDWKRTGLWFVIGFSSLPLHLMYNSAVFGTTEANTYWVGIGAENILEPDSIAALQRNYTRYQNETLDRYSSSTASITGEFIGEGDLAFMQLLLNDTTNDTEWATLTPEECITQYNKELVDDYSDLVVLLEGREDVENLTGLYCGTIHITGMTGNDQPLQNWICNFSPGSYSADGCDPAGTLSELKKGVPWTQCEKPVKECRARKTPETNENCKVQYSLVILSIVIAFNLLKVVAMTLALKRSKERPIVTVGDAVQSFMQRPDSTTEGLCCADKQFFWSRRAWKNGLKNPVVWQSTKRRWWSAVRWTRWLICYFLVFVALIVTIVLLRNGLRGDKNHGLKVDLEHIWERGIGQPNVASLVHLDVSSSGGLSYDIGLVPAALVSNIPQVVLSFLYFIYNGIFTCMLMQAEYSRFASHRKSLRVTDPTGQQRSTHFLHLPYTYSIPLSILSFGLHWLTSQCIFVVSLEFLPSPGVIAGAVAQSTYYVTGTDPNATADELRKVNIETVSSCGYSVGAVILIIPIIVLAMIIPLGIGAKWFESEMPIVGSCSAAISAACQPALTPGTKRLKESEEDLSYRGYASVGDDEEMEDMGMLKRRQGAALKPLMWGVVVRPEENGGVGHLAFSPDEVERPEDLKKYV